MRVAAIAFASAVLGALLVMSSGGVSLAQPVQTEARLVVPAGACIQVTHNYVGIITVASIRNKCDEPFTVVLYTTVGPQVINAPPRFEASLNTTMFNRWKVCQGISNPAC